MYVEKRHQLKVGSLITVEMLDSLDACDEDVEVFERSWPDGIRLRLKNLKRAAKLDLDVYWFAAEILDHRGRWSEFDRFLEVYGKSDEDDAMQDAALALWEIIKKR